MITDETFYKEVMQSFKDLRNKMDELHEDTNEKIQDLCDKISKTNSKIDEHLAVNEALEEKTKEDLEKRDKKFYVIMALMSVGFTLFEITTRFI
jgi:peptidoglycan hydrolase CwlO-like protein